MGPAQAKQNSFLIAPSLLAADFARLGEEITAVEKAGADWIHVDVMDGHFVPNLTMGPQVVKSIRPVTKLPLDVHLMIEAPERLIRDFVAAGADYLTLHVESTPNILAALKQIRALKCKAGITLRPGTPIESILPALGEVDLVLVMTVEPGFGGQSFMHDQISKLARLKEERRQGGLNFLIEVDGGINDQTAALVRDADVLVAGNFVFKNEYAKAIQKLKSARG